MPETTQHPDAAEVNLSETCFARCRHGIGGPHQYGHSICDGPQSDDACAPGSYLDKYNAAQRRWDRFYANPANGYC